MKYPLLPFAFVCLEKRSSELLINIKEESPHKAKPYLEKTIGLGKKTMFKHGKRVGEKYYSVVIDEHERLTGQAYWLL